MRFSRHPLVLRIPTFVLLNCLFLTAFETAMGHTKSLPLPAAKITLSSSEITISKKQTIGVSATVLDRQGKELRNARIDWAILVGGKGGVALQPIDRFGHSILLTAGDTLTPNGDVFVRAKSGGVEAFLTVHVQDSEPAGVTFPDGKVVELAVLDRKVVAAWVVNSQGARINDAVVRWQVADPDHESFVHVGSNVNKNGINSAQLTWLAGKPDIKVPSEIKIYAFAGESDKRGVLTVKYLAPKAEAVKIEVKSKDKIDPLSLLAGDAKTLEVTVRGKDEVLLDIDLKEFTVEVADESSRDFIKLSVEKKEKEKVFNLTVIALPGTAQKAPNPFIDTQLIIRTKGEIKLIPVSFRREATTVTWDILPPTIVGDNYGRTIKKDYYCIEVAIQNFSGSDVALSGLNFFKDVPEAEKNADGTIKKNPDGTDKWVYRREFRPNTTYATVHGSLEKRKLTHSRTLILSIIDGVGSLLTGFNPFFHVDSHRANFSTFIDIISNPLAKGLASAWKDPVPDEVKRFETDVLKDGQIIAKDGFLKTKIFVPKRALFGESENEKKNRDNLAEVKKRLGSLMILGYRIEKGPIQPIYQGQ